MPPKPTTATRPPSRTRTTARKSALPTSSVKISPPPPPPQPPPPIIINSPTTNTTTAPILDNSRVKKTLSIDRSSTLAKCSSSSANKSVAIENQSHNPMENAVIEKPIEVLNEGDVATTKKGTRKVIKKTIKVVKRVIKRRVPKSQSRLLSDNDDNNNNVVVIDKPNVVVDDDLVAQETSNVSRVETGVSEPVNVDNALGLNDDVGHELVVGDQVDGMGIDTGILDKEAVFANETTLGSETEQKRSPVKDGVTDNLRIQEEESMGTSEDRYWAGISSPVLGDKSPVMNDGRVVNSHVIVDNVKDTTGFQEEEYWAGISSPVLGDNSPVMNDDRVVNSHVIVDNVKDTTGFQEEEYWAGISSPVLVDKSPVMNDDRVVNSHVIVDNVNDTTGFQEEYWAGISSPVLGDKSPVVNDDRVVNSHVIVNDTTGFQEEYWAGISSPVLGEQSPVMNDDKVVVNSHVIVDTVNDTARFHDDVALQGHKLVVGDDKGDEVDMMGTHTSFPDKEVEFATETTHDEEEIRNPVVTENVSIQEESNDTSENSYLEGLSSPMLGDDQKDENGKQAETEGNHSVVECNEGGLLLSDELEALERKKRRKTEIFVGGLEKDVKEEDILKAFQVAGTVVSVDLVMNTRKNGKNKGFAFVRFSNAAEANIALTKYFNVKICGRQSHVQPVQGNDTIYLGNIERNWKAEDVTTLLEKAGVDKIDKVIVKADPRNFDRNRGFAFVEFETNRAAQNAFTKLQTRNVFGKNAKIRVAWAEPLVEPAEEDILKVKAVYAEYIPSSWNEVKVKDYFKRFGEIESVAHSKVLTSSRRNDFAFINYKTREAALACIEAIKKERVVEDEGSKVKMTVSLARPHTMGKQLKNDTSASRKQLSKHTSKVSTAPVKLHEPRNSGTYASSSYNHGRGNTTEELMHLLRRQASTNQIPPRGTTGPFVPENHIPVHGHKRPFPFAGHDPLYMESRGIPRARFEYSNPIPGPSYLPHGHEREPFPRYYQQPGHGLTAESVHGRNVYPRHFPTRGRERSPPPPPPYGNSNIYRQY